MMFICDGDTPRPANADALSILRTQYFEALKQAG
jgi:hypothetical protein